MGSGRAATSARCLQWAHFFSVPSCADVLLRRQRRHKQRWAVAQGSLWPSTRDTRGGGSGRRHYVFVSAGVRPTHGVLLYQPSRHAGWPEWSWAWLGGGANGRHPADHRRLDHSYATLLRHHTLHGVAARHNPSQAVVRPVSMVLLRLYGHSHRLERVRRHANQLWIVLGPERRPMLAIWRPEPPAHGHPRAHHVRHLGHSISPRPHDLVNCGVQARRREAGATRNNSSFNERGPGCSVHWAFQSRCKRIQALLDCCCHHVGRDGLHWCWCARELEGLLLER